MKEDLTVSPFVDLGGGGCERVAEGDLLFTLWRGEDRMGEVSQEIDRKLAQLQEEKEAIGREMGEGSSVFPLSGTFLACLGSSRRSSETPSMTLRKSQRR